MIFRYHGVRIVGLETGSVAMTSRMCVAGLFAISVGGVPAVADIVYVDPTPDPLFIGGGIDLDLNLAN